MNKINTVVFDLDGTLLDTLDDLHDAMNYIMKKYGFPLISRDTARMAVGSGMRVMMERTLPRGELTPDFDKIVVDFSEYYAKHSLIKTKPYSGIPELLGRLSADGYKLAVVSNKQSRSVVELAKYFFGEFSLCAIGENEKAGIPKKPSPEMVFAALDAVEGTADTAVYVGDSDIDIVTAKNAGLPCISVTWGFRDEEFLRGRGAEIFAYSPSGIFDVIEKM